MQQQEIADKLRALADEAEHDSAAGVETHLILDDLVADIQKLAGDIQIDIDVDPDE